MRIEERSADHDKDIKRTRELDSSDIVRYNDIANVNCNKLKHLTILALGSMVQVFHYAFFIYLSPRFFAKKPSNFASKMHNFAS